MGTQNEVVRLSESPSLLKTIVYRQSQAYTGSLLGGFFVVCLLKAYLFRLSNPDEFYVWLAGVIGFLGVVFIIFTAKLVLSPDRLTGSSFGHTWVDVPWYAVAEIEMFKTPIVKILGRPPMGGRRAIGFRVKPEYKGKIRPKTPYYGYDANIPSMWDFSLDRVADQCVAQWHAHGGTGELVDRVEHDLLPQPAWSDPA
jgi:hypothetical protein